MDVKLANPWNMTKLLHLSFAFEIQKAIQSPATKSDQWLTTYFFKSAKL